MVDLDHLDAAARSDLAQDSRAALEDVGFHQTEKRSDTRNLIRGYERDGVALLVTVNEVRLTLSAETDAYRRPSRRQLTGCTEPTPTSTTSGTCRWFAVGDRLDQIAVGVRSALLASRWDGPRCRRDSAAVKGQQDLRGGGRGNRAVVATSSAR